MPRIDRQEGDTSVRHHTALSHGNIGHRLPDSRQQVYDTTAKYRDGTSAAGFSSGCWPCDTSGDHTQLSRQTIGCGFFRGKISGQAVRVHRHDDRNLPRPSIQEVLQSSSTIEHLLAKIQPVLFDRPGDGPCLPQTFCGEDVQGNCHEQILARGHRGHTGRVAVNNKG